MPVRVSAIVLATTCLALCSCGNDQGFRKETHPVTGEIYVDGQPVNQLAVTAHNVSGMDAENPTTSAAFTGEDGKFEISTYEKSDGVPEGEYVLTFRWGEWNMISMQYVGDKFNGKYMDPKKSEHRVKVVSGEEADLGRIDLSL